MDLTEIVAEIKAEARLPAIVISAHEKTLDALVALANRIVALEARIPPNADEIAKAYGLTTADQIVKRGPGRPRKTAE